MRASLARQPATLKVAAIGFVIGILLYIAIRSRQRGVTFGRPRPPPPPPHSHRPPPRPGEEWGPPQDGYWGGEGPGDFSDERENWGLFVPRAQLPEAGKFGEKKNLVDEKEESYYGALHCRALLGQLMMFELHRPLGIGLLYSPQSLSRQCKPHVHFCLHVSL